MNFVPPASRAPRAPQKPREPHRLMGASPPVAVLLVRAAPALQFPAEPVTRLARLMRLGGVAGSALARRICGEPPLNERRLRGGGPAKADGESEQGRRQRDCHDDRRRHRPAAGPRSRDVKSSAGSPHLATDIGVARPLQAPVFSSCLLAIGAPSAVTTPLAPISGCFRTSTPSGVRAARVGVAA